MGGISLFDIFIYSCGALLHCSSSVIFTELCSLSVKANAISLNNLGPT